MSAHKTAATTGREAAAPATHTPDAIDALMRAGKLREAEHAARELLTGEPDFARVHYYLGVTLYRTRRYEGAVEELTRALAMRPIWGRAHYDLALAYTRLDRLDEAQAELTIAEEQAHASHLPSIRAAQADILARRGERRAARKLAEEAATIAGVTPALGRLLGELRRDDGDFSGSASALKLAIEAAPEDPSLRWALGWTLALLGRDDDARDQYDLADRIEARTTAQSASTTSWLVSYPKTGATWVRAMLAHAMRSSLDRRGLLPPGSPRTIDTGSVARLDPSWPRLVWTHDDADAVREDASPVDTRRLFVSGARERYAGAPVVLLLRDPRDTVVSAFHQATKRTGRPVRHTTPGAFARDPELGLDRFLRFCSVWSEALEKPAHAEIVTYEQLIADPADALRRVTRSLSIVEIESTDLSQAVDACRADLMRDAERAGDIEGMRTFSDDPNAAKVRTARPGSHRDELSPKDVAWCDKRVRDALPTLAEPIRNALEASMAAASSHGA